MCFCSLDVLTHFSPSLDGLVQVSFDDTAEPMECSLPGMVDNPPKFLEMKGIDSAISEISVFYDCVTGEGEERNEVEKI